MNKRIVIAVAFILVAVLAVVGYLLTRNNSTPISQQADSRPSATSQSTPQVNNMQSIQNLLASNQSVTCKVSQPEANLNGTVYVSNNKVRGDFNSKVNGKDVATHTIFSDNTAYVWTDLANQGTKIKIDPNNIPATGSAQAANLNTQFNVECQPWTVDSTKFTPPSTINFIAL